MNNLLGVSSSFFAQPTAEKWRSAAEAGITETELGLTRDLPIEDILEKAQHLCEMLSLGGMRVSSIHLPFGGEWDISALDEPRHSFAMQNIKALLDWVGEKRIGIAVLHPSYEPVKEAVRPARLGRATEAIAWLGDYARERNVTLAVENLPRTCLGNCAQEMLALTGNGRSTSMCFDVNHLLLESHRGFYEQVAPHIVTMHLSDYDRVNERHWFPGDGCIDWAELAGLFEAHGYAGRYVFEIGEASSPALGRPFSPAELVERFRRITGRTIHNAQSGV